MNIQTLRKAVIELHDFTPKYYDDNLRTLEALDKIGRDTKRVIHIVPNWGGEYNILKNKKFLDIILDLNKGGDEIVLHGNTHKRSSNKYPSLYKKFLGEWRYRGEAEFFASNYAEALMNIKEGKEIFNQAKIKTEGFVPPTWLFSKEAEQAAIDEGFKYVGLRHSIRIIDKSYQSNKRDIASTCLEFTARPRIADYIFRAYNKQILHKFEEDKDSVMRFPIHPQDLIEKSTAEYMFKTLSQISNTIKLVTLKDLVVEKYNSTNSVNNKSIGDG